ncbi:MAG: DEAD/DEAH box helicase [Caulobacteraceae bacterium]|nr:DEAD/DEAH box helicase [Caulobacteraceae bacterium]
MTIALRSYQQRGVEQLRTLVLQGRKRIVLTLPTGGGKTPLAAHIIHSARTNFDGRVLFVAPWVQLIEQAVVQLARWGITDVGVLRGDDKRTNPAAPVQVASRETLRRRERPEADIVLIDECHRAPESIVDAYWNSTIIGLSATPVGLKGVFEDVVVAGTYAELIAGGFLAEPTVFGTKRKVDLSGVRSVGGDYQQAELESAMMDSAIVGDVIEGYLERGKGHKAVCFAAGVAHSQALAERFRAAGIPAEHIDGTTPMDERAAVLARLESGETRVVCNMGVLTEGWDQPSVRCCILARPTKSLALYKQMVGRVLRPHPSGDPIVLDHAGNVLRHGMPHDDIEWLLSDARPTRKAGVRECGQCFAVLEAGTPKCPHCAFVFEVAERKPVVEVAGSMERITAVDHKRRYFDEQIANASLRGFKPGFASAKFKEKFGAWPPFAWTAAAKARFAHDPEWQRRQTERAKEKAFWEEVNARQAAKQAASAEDEPPAVYEPVDDADFWSWLEQHGVTE